MLNVINAGMDQLEPARDDTKGVILIVDDDASSLRLLSTLLDNEEYWSAPRARASLSSCNLPGRPWNLSRETSLCLFRITQESLRNISKHAANASS